jgi:hypothetical protein
MIIKGETKGHRGGVSKQVIIGVKEHNASEIVEDVKKYYGWENVKVVK